MVLDRYKIGVLLALLSAVSFALSNTFAGMAYMGGSTPFTLSAARFFLPTVLLLAILSFQKSQITLPRNSGFIAIILGVITILYTMALLSAIERLPVSLAILIFYLFPIITGVILGLTGWGRFSLQNVLGTLIAFCGLALALGISESQLDNFGIILAVAAALGLASVSAISSQLIKEDDPRQVTFYMAATALIVMCGILVVRSELDLPTTQSGWVGFVLSNCFYAAAMIGFFYAISFSGPRATTFFSNLEPIVVTAAAFLFLGEMLLPLQLLGVFIVVGALLFFGQQEDRKAEN